MWQKYQQLITMGNGNKSAVIKGREVVVEGIKFNSKTATSEVTKRTLSLRL